MCKSVYIFLLGALIFTACKKKESGCPADSYHYIFKDNAQVDTSALSGGFLIAQAGPGSKRVFAYSWSRLYGASCSIQLADALEGSILLFEADPAVSYFKYTSDKLAGAKCYFRYICYGCSPAAIPASGTIEGTKISDHEWKVSIDLKTAANETLALTANFIQQ